MHIRHKCTCLAVSGVQQLGTNSRKRMVCRCRRQAGRLVSHNLRPSAALPFPGLPSYPSASSTDAAVVLRRNSSDAPSSTHATANPWKLETHITAEDDLPDQLLTAALPFVRTHGFSAATIMAGVASRPELQRLAISRWTLSGLFPSTTTTSTTNISNGIDRGTHAATEPIGPSKALAERWIQEGNSHMKTRLKNEHLGFKKDRLAGVRRAFEIRLEYNRTIPKEHLLKALALVVTPKHPFFGLPLPLELPHFLPYGSHALAVATDALAGLKDYSKAREWMLRRIRLAGVYSAIELMSIGTDQSPVSLSNELQNLLDASESLATHTANTVEFISYVHRSQRSIIQSLGLI
ncbi:hypothetical protein PGT21_019389 [Puccinia graminis f. sp. tritici]|uniref:Ubiquinone biosynthesis protein n=1 Tax=Puccinia graminis f. sp. tritici TaxID=56615 RepID=A0A5B0Q6P2_PUCGR|nr:hypothetical protein PGT21_019389 [Puccinia graminis f. sp. tritici]